MPPPSLLQLSTAAAIRNVKCMQIPASKLSLLTIISDLNDIGNIPYALARPFLLKIESPEKLVSGPILSYHIAYKLITRRLENPRTPIPPYNNRRRRTLARVNKTRYSQMGRIRPPHQVRRLVRHLPRSPGTGPKIRR